MDTYLIKKDLTKGLHFYISFKNLNNLMHDDLLNHTTKYAKLLKAINEYLVTLESECKSLSPNIYIEKIADSRIHCVIEECEQLPKFFYLIVSAAFNYIDVINDEIMKKSGLPNLIINCGVDYGFYVDYATNFEINNEDNSIGYPCNKAAKIQSEANDFEILLSKASYARLIIGDFKYSVKSLDPSRKILSGTIYEGEICYSIRKYELEITRLENEYFINESLYNQFRKKISIFDDRILNESQIANLSGDIKTNCSVLYCDIRGFTRKFNKDGSNLVSMAKHTSDCLEKMYNCTRGNMQHLQFQGDRELAISDRDIGRAIKNAFLLIEEFKKQQKFLTESQILDTSGTSIGIGIAFGDIFLAHVGIRGSKDPLVLGNVPVYADYAEDKIAKRDFKISLHKSAYEEATKNPTDPLCLTVKSCFVISSNPEYYISKDGISYAEYSGLFTKFYNELNSQNQSNTGAKPWRAE